MCCDLKNGCLKTNPGPRLVQVLREAEEAAAARPRLLMYRQLEVEVELLTERRLAWTRRLPPAEAAPPAQSLLTARMRWRASRRSPVRTQPLAITQAMKLDDRRRASVCRTLVMRHPSPSTAVLAFVDSGGASQAV